ncbi:hypothetical protein ACP70R_049034 [Stipagrostis hirtigluma subsp. patula]
MLSSVSSAIRLGSPPVRILPHLIRGASKLPPIPLRRRSCIPTTLLLLKPLGGTHSRSSWPRWLTSSPRVPQPTEMNQISGKGYRWTQQHQVRGC